MTPKEVAEAENISLKGLYNILYGMRECPTKVWRGYEFTKVGKNWECSKAEAS